MKSGRLLTTLNGCEILLSMPSRPAVEDRKRRKELVVLPDAKPDHTKRDLGVVAIPAFP